MMKLINCERFNTNDNEYSKLVDGMRGATFEVSKLHFVFFQDKTQSSKSTIVRLADR